MNSERSFAIGEVEALVLKAYRGAGFSWGMSQEAGKAAGWLTGKQLPALDAFAALLNRSAGQSHDQLAPETNVDSWPSRWASKSSLLCPVIAGALLSDLGPSAVENTSSVSLESVAAPLILVPFVATLGVPVIFRVASLEACICGDAIDPLSVFESLAGTQDVVLQFVDRRQGSVNEKTPPEASAKMQGNRKSALRGVGQVESVDRLETLAQKTYVPATQASREAGAGAGLNDND